MTVDVIIPTYKPNKEFFTILDQLEKQTVKVSHVIVINTEEKYFSQLVYGRSFKETYQNLQVMHISKKEFDHADTRKRAVMHSKADVFVMMTMDAVPADAFLIERLLEPLQKPQVAVSYARQLPKEDCMEIERFTRKFNYPDVSMEKSKKDIPQLGIKTYFCSDVCAAYKRDIFLSLGGYVRRAIFNEDMLYAAKAVQAGYSIAYASQAMVYHSHNYSGREQLMRNFDLGVSQAEHPEVFDGLPSESEGVKMVKMTAAHLWKNGHKEQMVRLFYTSGCKYLGYKLGKNYRRLSKKAILRLTANRDYWRKKEWKNEVERIDATKGYGRNPEKES